MSAARQRTDAPWINDPEFRKQAAEWDRLLAAEDLGVIRNDDHEARRAQRGAEQLAEEASIRETQWLSENRWKSRRERLRFALIAEGWAVTEIQERCPMPPTVTLLTAQQHVAKQRKLAREKGEK